MVGLGSIRKRRFKTAMIWVLVLCFSFGMLAFPQPAQADGYKVKYVTFDGGPNSDSNSEPIKISAHYMIPKGDAPKGGFPAVVFIHSWALFQNEYDYQMAKFANEGYVTICYECRGWYGADGHDQVAGPLMMKDLNKVVDYIIDELDVNPDKIGATGISYGGGHSLLALQFEPRIKCIVPMSGWTDLVQSLNPNNTFSTAWACFLAGSGMVMANPDSTVIDMMKKAFDYADFSKLQEAQDRSILMHIDEVNARSYKPPMFMIQGLNEDLFPTRQMKEFYDQYEGQKKIMFCNSVHATAELPGCLGLPTIPSNVWKDTLRWFDYHLRGIDNGIMDEDPISIYQKWSKGQRTYDEWPDYNMLPLYLTKTSGKVGKLNDVDRGSGSINIKNNPWSFATTSGIFMISPALRSYANAYIIGTKPDKLGKGAYAFDTPTLEDDVTVMGIPKFTFEVKPNKDIFQVNCLIYDVDEKGTARLIHFVPYTDPHADGGEINRFDFLALHYIAHRFEEGHKIRLVVSTNNSSQFRPVQESFSLDVLLGSGTKMELPVVD